MADISILLDEQNSLKFDVEVQGVKSSSIQPRFIIEADNMDLSFNGTFSDNQVTVDLPILANALSTSEYKCRLEFVVEGEKFFKPMEAVLEAILPTRIRAGISNNVVPRQTTNEVAVGAACLATVEPVAEAEELLVDVSPEDQQLMAIMQVIVDRYKDEESAAAVKSESFVQLVSKMGVNITVDSLMDKVDQGIFGELIQDMNQDEIIFQGTQDGNLDVGPGVSDAEDIVKKNATRNAKAGIKK